MGRTLHRGGRAAAVLACVCTERESISSLSDELSCTPRQIQNALVQLRARGLVEMHVGGRGGAVVPTREGRAAIMDHLRRLRPAAR
jgi:predicted ArsR family transcriptional regulator